MAKVLVVDHERSIRRWLTDSLGKCGYDVVEPPLGKRRWKRLPASSSTLFCWMTPCREWMAGRC